MGKWVILTGDRDFSLSRFDGMRLEGNTEITYGGSTR